MAAVFQASLLDADEETAPGPLGATVGRTALRDGAWIDVRRGWLRGADALFDRLLMRVPWRAERRQMYERGVDVPPPLCFYAQGETPPDPPPHAARRAPHAPYRAEPGEPLP